MTTDEIRAKLEEHRSVLGKGPTDLENSINLVSAHLALLTEAVLLQTETIQSALDRVGQHWTTYL